MQQLPTDARPPFVSFEVRAVEDRQKSLADGVYATKDVDFIRIVPHGSEGKTVLEYPYDEWLARTRKQTMDFRVPGGAADIPLMAGSRFPETWLRMIQDGYKAWKEGRELPTKGTPLRNWPVISPAMLRNCEQLHILTVEELADATDDTASSIGMGGVILRQRARDWVQANAGGAGKVSAELEALRADSANKDMEIKKLQDQIAALSKQKAA